MKNIKGPIAETYIDLQGLPALEKASNSYPIEKCSTWGIVKILLQCSEIGIQNLNDLLSRIVTDLNNNRLKKATAKLSWVRDVNGILIRISNLNNLICNEILNNSSELGITDSRVKTDSIYKELDISISRYLERKSIKLSKVLETQTLSDDLYKFLHDYRVIAHELLIWHKSLNQYFIPEDTDYSDFIGLQDITDAVINPYLKGDTFFMQFRCLHQIPELITAEVNDRIEAAILDIRNTEIETAHKHLRIANELFLITLDTFKPLIDNLSHNDYHRFREYLGLTSGSHSINLHFYLFRDLYPLITTEYVTRYFVDPESYENQLIKDLTQKGIENELLKLRNSINHWRDLHLNLPRIDLGENKTKSLIGSIDAVETARAMKAAAEAKDPFNKIANLYISKSTNEKLDLTDYIRSEKSFDSKLGMELGKITQIRFKQVQEREGFFAKPILFKGPTKRII